MGSHLELPGRENFKSGPVDLSPSVTTVAFDPVLPLLRVPVPAGESDDPSKGHFVLAFRNEETWRRAWLSCGEKIAQQCEAGAKVGCSITAATVCRPPWWKTYLPFVKTGLDDQAKRAECEEKEMMGCLASSHERCTKFARETCDPIFANMRIAAPGVVIDPRFTSKRLLRQKISRHDKITPRVPAEKNLSCDQLEQVPLSQIVPDNVSMPELKQSSVTNFYGRQLMRDDKLDVWERKSPVWNNLNKEENVTTPGTTDGWVGGLVRPEYGSEADKISSGRHRGISDILKTVRPEWWQKFQHSLIERFSF